MNYYENRTSKIKTREEELAIILQLLLKIIQTEKKCFELKIAPNFINKNVDGLG